MYFKVFLSEIHLKNKIFYNMSYFQLYNCNSQMISSFSAAQFSINFECMNKQIIK